MFKDGDFKNDLEMICCNFSYLPIYLDVLFNFWLKKSDRKDILQYFIKEEVKIFEKIHYFFFKKISDYKEQFSSLVYNLLDSDEKIAKEEFIKVYKNGLNMKYMVVEQDKDMKISIKSHFPIVKKICREILMNYHGSSDILKYYYNSRNQGLKGDIFEDYFHSYLLKNKGYEILLNDKCPRIFIDNIIKIWTINMIDNPYLLEITKSLMHKTTYIIPNKSNEYFFDSYLLRYNNDQKTYDLYTFQYTLKKEKEKFIDEKHIKIFENLKLRFKKKVAHHGSFSKNYLILHHDCVEK